MRSSAVSADVKSTGLRQSVEAYANALKQHQTNVGYMLSFADSDSEVFVDWCGVYSQCSDVMKKIYEIQVAIATELGLLDDTQPSSDGPSLLMMGFPFEDDASRGLLGHVKASPPPLKLLPEASDRSATQSESSIEMVPPGKGKGPIPRSVPGWEWDQPSTVGSNPKDLRRAVSTRRLSLSNQGPSGSSK
jgi:hypothetical protein